jgi:hypothetical protein
MRWPRRATPPPLHGGSTDSLNWSGYVVRPAKGTLINGVASTFIVPKAGLAPPGFAATWAGIGGYNSSDLVQAGVAEQSAPNSPLGPQYYAWYELLPASETQLTNCSGERSCAVSPGQVVTVTIDRAATSSWTIVVADAGHWRWSKTVRYASTRSSAEWILEAPSLVAAPTTLAPVGTVHFGPLATYTENGVTRALGAGSPTRVLLSPGAVNIATPSAITRGQLFNDCAYAQSCSRPR